MLKTDFKVKQKIHKDLRALQLEVLEKVSGLATAGLGLVAALAWNKAIQDLFVKLFPSPGDNLLASFSYALFITIIVVIITIQLGRAINLAKKPLNQGKKEDEQ